MGLNTMPGQAGYTAAKHGVVGLMRLFANQLAKNFIRVNTVHPSAVNTPMVANAEYGEFINTHPDVASDPAFKNPMPVEMIEAVDISNAMVFLASDEARYITGVTLPVDAGYNNR
ncbi:SDR family oxidoreductase [uncultured Gordonia sp.]|jgi:NAD(P)-dependent dehydrogenase (short-subunit alcohol dehydrogenase family)|uniref:SDR family oxidoreductase n=1 Tax=Gordonia sp. (in: high G+C Gram-positive bacteria) TaxID=84139 RepID=UPI002602B0B7|nr:SDR family oxidoreductase [uncultured Gordonia sp.]HMS75412.1 SDR family oxidoreductase [Gordonia sp. (in: high G+C Gram-positive bacteria)]HQV18502.1 SDR family oxidoreductase [Gordonia sp. (in: high G+C Gram-positive bacteria)]